MSLPMRPSWLLPFCAAVLPRPILPVQNRSLFRFEIAGMVDIGDQSRLFRLPAQQRRVRSLEVGTSIPANIANQPKMAVRLFPRLREAFTRCGASASLEKLAAAERRCSETLPPIEALRAWMLLFVDYIGTKKIIAPALNTLVGGPSKVFEASHTQVWEAIHSLVKRAIKSGGMRKDLDPLDLLRALIGVANVATGPDWRQSARRLVDILITGSRPAQIGPRLWSGPLRSGAASVRVQLLVIGPFLPTPPDRKPPEPRRLHLHTDRGCRGAHRRAPHLLLLD